MKTAIYYNCARRSVAAYGFCGASAQDGLFTTERDCAVDIKSLCAGVAPGEGRILACLQSHVARRTLRGLFDNSVEGHLDRPAMRRRH